MVPPHASTSSSMCGAMMRIVPGKSWAGSANRYSAGSDNVFECLQGLPGTFIPAEPFGSSQAAGTERGLNVRIHQYLPDRLRDGFGRRRIYREGGIARDLPETIERGGDDGSTTGQCFGDRNRERFRKGRVQEEIGQRVDRRQIRLIDPSRKVNVAAVASVRNRVLRPESLAAFTPYHELVPGCAVIDLVSLENSGDVLPGAPVVARQREDELVRQAVLALHPLELRRVGYPAKLLAGPEVYSPDFPRT